MHSKDDLYADQVIIPDAENSRYITTVGDQDTRDAIFSRSWITNNASPVLPMDFQGLLDIHVARQKVADNMHSNLVIVHSAKVAPTVVCVLFGIIAITLLMFRVNDFLPEFLIPIKESLPMVELCSFLISTFSFPLTVADNCHHGARQVRSTSNAKLAKSIKKLPNWTTLASYQVLHINSKSMVEKIKKPALSILKNNQDGLPELGMTAASGSYNKCLEMLAFIQENKHKISNDLLDKYQNQFDVLLDQFRDDASLMMFLLEENRKLAEDQKQYLKQLEISMADQDAQRLMPIEKKD